MRYLLTLCATLLLGCGMPTAPEMPSAAFVVEYQGRYYVMENVQAQPGAISGNTPDGKIHVFIGGHLIVDPSKIPQPEVRRLPPVDDMEGVE